MSNLLVAYTTVVVMDALSTRNEAANNCLHVVVADLDRLKLIYM